MSLDKLDLREGSVVVLPTETVYGLVCLASDKKAVERLYKLKNRDKNPGTLIASSVEQLVQLGIKRRYIKPIEHLWPNSLSIIVPSEPQHKYLDLGKGSLAVRIPAADGLRKILESTGPLLTSSCNKPGQKTATTIGEARNYFGNKVDNYYDGGDLSENKPSTIIRIIDDAVEVIREGAVKLNEKGEIQK